MRELVEQLIPATNTFSLQLELEQLSRKQMDKESHYLLICKALTDYFKTSWQWRFPCETFTFLASSVRGQELSPQRLTVQFCGSSLCRNHTGKGKMTISQLYTKIYFINLCTREEAYLSAFKQ